MKIPYYRFLLLIVLLSLSTTPLHAQNKFVPRPKPNWHNLDLAADGMFGISTEKAYTELLKGKTPVKVVVAVIDGGVDTAHEDLKAVLWRNPAEIAGNRADDDKNGYADDVYGWDFIGSAKGDVQYDNLELTRMVKRYWLKFAYTDPATLNAADLKVYQEQKRLEKALEEQVQEARGSLENVKSFKKTLDIFEHHIGNKNPSVNDLINYRYGSGFDEAVKDYVLKALPEFKDYADFRRKGVDEAYIQLQERLNYHLNVDFDSRDTVADNYADSRERFYGNNDVTGPDADHGTHVAGIIGAVRDNNIGVKGVANSVAIMSVRTVPNGDERDKDVANAIRYAADNGAKVISMSFGKSYSWDKKAVDDAVKYAMSKDVLLVHAAGNDNQDNDASNNFPNPVYEDKSGRAEAWIEVGASGYINDKTLKASFSNYGKNSVDVFAPGVAINSTVPGSKYDEHDGTSMAAPVVSGLAALIRSYYPKLTAVQVKDVILRSVTKVNHDVTVKVGKKDKEKSMPFAALCKAGGIVNAYQALKLAATY